MATGTSCLMAAGPLPVKWNKFAGGPEWVPRCPLISMPMLRNPVVFRWLLAGLLLSGFGFRSATVYGQSTTATSAHKSLTARIREGIWHKRIAIYDTSASLVINRIEDINSTMNDMNEVVASGFDTGEIFKSLPGVERTVRMIGYNINNRSGSMNLRSLALVDNILDQDVQELKNWQSSLFEYSTELVSFTVQIRSMTHDSTLRNLPTDSSLQYLYEQQLGQLKKKWKTEDSLVRKSLVRINAMQGEVADNYLEGVALQSRIDALIRNFWTKASGKEYPYLWEGGWVTSTAKGFREVMDHTGKISGKILSYYIRTDWDLRCLNILILLLFFFWTFFNLARIRNRKEDPLDLNKRLNYVRGIPLVASLVIMLTLMPLINMHPPAIYQTLTELALAACLTVLLARRWSHRLFLCWIILAGLFEVHSFGNLLISSQFMPRIWLLVMDLVSTIFGFFLLRQIRRESSILEGYVPFLSILYIILNLLALGFNIFGRVTLAELLSTTAVASFFLGISLMVFIRILLEGIFLQLEADKKTTRFTAYLDYEKVERKLKKTLTLFAGIFWLVNLSENLNVYNNLQDVVTAFLGAERQVGSTTFTFGSVVVFFLVIWLAHILQKYIGYFFGDTRDLGLPEKKSGLSTSILLIRLVIIVAGFLLGVAASGLPVDKITVVIGALGVGIGLGLQGVVNQLVSGIILAIEKPIRIGDSVDIGNKSGRVKEIGIRSTRLITPDGAEIIVPNADLLSQNLVNWTANNNHIRIEILLKMENGSDLDKASSIIHGILDKNPDVMKKPEPLLLFPNFDQTGIGIQILVWAFDINKTHQLKSDLLREISRECGSQGIKLI